VTTLWHDSPPATPPTTDADPCAEWAGEGDHGPDGHPGLQPPSPATPTSTHEESQPWTPDHSHWSGAPTPPPLPPQASSSRPSRGGGARVALLAAAVAGLVSTGFVARGLVDQPTASAPPTTAAASGPASNGQPNNGGSVSHAQLGVSLEPTTDGQAGAQVSAVSPGSAADKAGVQQGDVITTVDGKAMKSGDDVAGAISAKSAGDTVELTISRNGTTTTVTATLDAKSSSTPSSPSPTSSPPTTQG